MTLTTFTRTTATLATVLLALAAASLAQDPCAQIAGTARDAGTAGAEADLFTALALAHNLGDPSDRQDAIDDAYDEFIDAVDEVARQHRARLELCARTGGGRFEPDIDPADFVAVVDNPLLPFLPGATRTFRKTLPGGVVETVELTVLNETREILGVDCTVVRDVAREGGEVVEETLDYYAQDADGNVWYFGELSMNFEDGYLTDLDGSWIGGVGGAQPGVLMYADPIVGVTYRQEFALGEAEDAGLVLSRGASVAVPAGSWSGCVVTFDFTPLEADSRERKTYAPGIGAVLEVDEVTGERLELIAYTL